MYQTGYKIEYFALTYTRKDIIIGEMKDSFRVLNLYYLARKDILYGYSILRQRLSGGLRKECVSKRKAPKE